jgi:L-fuculose-phosphate aldolase
LGNGLKTITGGQAKELIALRESLGMSDFRASLKECELCDNADFHPGVVCQTPLAQPAATDEPADSEQLVQQITDMIMRELSEK